MKGSDSFTGSWEELRTGNRLNVHTENGVLLQFCVVCLFVCLKERKGLDSLYAGQDVFSQQTTVCSNRIPINYISQEDACSSPWNCGFSKAKRHLQIPKKWDGLLLDGKRCWSKFLNRVISTAEWTDCLTDSHDSAGSLSSQPKRQRMLLLNRVSKIVHWY